MDKLQVQKVRVVKGCLVDASLRLKTMEGEIKQGAWGTDAISLHIDEGFARMRKEIDKMSQEMSDVLDYML